METTRKRDIPFWARIVLVGTAVLGLLDNCSPVTTAKLPVEPIQPQPKTQPLVEIESSATFIPTSISTATSTSTASATSTESQTPTIEPSETALPTATLTLNPPTATRIPETNTSEPSPTSSNTPLPSETVTPDCDLVYDDLCMWNILFLQDYVDPAPATGAPPTNIGYCHPFAVWYIEQRGLLQNGIAVRVASCP
jgi:hypothetical protein